MTKRLVKASITTLIILLSLVIIAGGSYWLRRDNLHVVVPGKVYRSAQLNSHTLSQVIHAYGIRSVINLRGSNPQQTWFQQEVQTTQRLGVMQYNLRFSSRYRPAPQLLRQLIVVLQTAPKPILLHCASGSDRTGFAAATVLLLKGESYAQAMQQIAWYYGVFSKHSIGYLSLPFYHRWLQAHHWHSSRMHFITWARQLKSW